MNELTLAEVRDYFSGDRIRCLECGKWFRTISWAHLLTHEMTVAEYKEKYGLPWRRGLSSEATHDLRRNNSLRLIADGVILTTPATPAQMKKMFIAPQRKRQPYRRELVDTNLEGMNKGKTGEEAERRRNMAKKGSPEFREKMLARPQTKNPNPKFIHYWKGKKQTPEHIRKRTQRRLGRHLAPKLVPTKRS